MIIILFNLKENLGVSQKKKKIFFSFLIDDVIEGVLHFHDEVIILFLYFVQTVISTQHWSRTTNSNVWTSWSKHSPKRLNRIPNNHGCI